MDIIARQKEKNLLQDILLSKSPELVAVYGRRRVGKTYLVRNFFEGLENVVYFELTGQKQESGEYASLNHQLANFSYQFERTFGREISTPETWQHAFTLLRKETEQYKNSDKTLILFFDELPWLCSPRSGFFESLDQAWNTTFERQPNVKVIVCGSAASWMLNKIIHARAGFSRRITRKIKLSPFTLGESQAYLRFRGFDLTRMSVAEIYMITGGIPYYFNFLSPHKSIYQNIDDECFDISGRLIDEYSIIFSSLFKNAEDHKKVIEYISSRHKGISLDDINSSFPALKGGSMNRILDNLISSDFITRTPPLFSKTKGAIYRVTDEFVLFYLKWIKSAPKTVFTSPNILYFQSLAQGGSYKSWRGFAFERLCLKHEYQIRKALGIHKILSIPSMVYFYDDLGKRSSQIDLLFDRADHVITICEMKYSETPFKITKTDIADLTRKKEDLRQYFTQKKKAQKDLHTCYVTTEGVEQNEYFHQIQPSVVTLTDMFHNDST